MSEYHVVVECPDTGKAVRTGVVLTALTDFDALAGETRAIACPHCGRTHEWGKADAWLEGGGRTPD